MTYETRYRVYPHEAGSLPVYNISTPYHATPDNPSLVARGVQAFFWLGRLDSLGRLYYECCCCWECI